MLNELMCFIEDKRMRVQKEKKVPKKNGSRCIFFSQWNQKRRKTQ